MGISSYLPQLVIALLINLYTLGSSFLTTILAIRGKFLSPVYVIKM